MLGDWFLDGQARPHHRSSVVDPRVIGAGGEVAMLQAEPQTARALVRVFSRSRSPSPMPPRLSLLVRTSFSLFHVPPLLTKITTPRA